MRPVIRPGLDVYRRSAEQLQLGTAPGSGMLLDDRPGLIGFLRLLDGVRDLATIECLARDDLPDLEDPPKALLDALTAEGIVIDAGTEAEDAIETAGVETRSHETTSDLMSATTDLLRDIGIHSAPSIDPSPTLVLIATRGAIDRDDVAMLVHGRVPHLPVVVDGPVVRLGPFVNPQTTPCVQCVDRQRGEWDPAWHAVLPQLGSPLAPLGGTQSAVSPPVRAATAAFIAEEISTFCDDIEPLTAARVVSIGPGAHDRDESDVSFHPDCPCRRL